MNARSHRRLRWAVPAAVLGLTIGASGASRVLPAGADPIPVLPALTPAQLLAKVRNAQLTTMSGDVRLSSHLGLPDLSSIGIRTGSLLDLLTGSHTSHVWIDGPEHIRVALDAPQAESDWIRNGNDLWSWDSAGQQVQHALVATSVRSGKATDAGTDDSIDGEASGPALDPATAADQLLAAIDPTTEVTVRTPGYVAGRPVYELVVTPRASTSTIGDGVVAVDAATGIPLAVRIDARDATSPALEVTFTAVSFDKPAASTFAFTPPPGATVTEVSDPTQLLPLGRHGGRDGQPEGQRSVASQSSGAVAAEAAATGSTAAVSKLGTHVSTVGTGWESVAIVSGLDLGRQFQALFANAPSVTVGSHQAHLVTTSLVNVLVFDDGRIAIAAMTPDALKAAVASL